MHSRPIVLPLLFLIAAPFAAQIPDEFTNLQLLPKDIPREELVSVMRAFAGSLGKRCNHCHVGEDPDSLDGYDFASDDKEPKQVARIMMQMTRDINTQILPLTERTLLTEVRCVTCHRGLARPESLDRILAVAGGEGGAPVIVARYRELREQFYGTGAYDFGPTTLNSLAEVMALRGNDVDGAIELVRTNVEFHPDVAYVHAMLGQLLAARGDREAAAASLERAIALEPGNDRVRSMLGRLRAAESQDEEAQP